MFILTFYKFLDQIKSSSILLLNRKSSLPSEVKLRFAFESPLFVSAPAATDKGNRRYNQTHDENESSTQQIKLLKELKCVDLNSDAF